MIPTLVINLLLYTGEFQQNLLLMLTGPKILIGRRLFVKRTGLNLKLIFTISTTEWMFATSSIHSLAKLSFYKIEWAPYSQTRSNWDPSNSNYGGKQRDCSQTRPKSIKEPQWKLHYLQALMKQDKVNTADSAFIFLIILLIIQNKWSGWSGQRKWSFLVWSLLER